MVKVKVFGAGSFAMVGQEPKAIYRIIKEFFEGPDYSGSLTVMEIKRGRKKKALALSGDSEVETTD